MVEEVVHRIMFRYPADMSEGDKRNITIKSGYRASASLKDQHKVVYRNLLKKNTLEGTKNTTGRSMTELNKRYPERYKELRVEFQKSMVQEWKVSGMRKVYNDQLKEKGLEVRDIVGSETPKSGGGFFTRLFRRGL